MTLVISISKETRAMCLKTIGETRYGGAHPSWACLRAVVKEYLSQRLESERGRIMCIRFKQLYDVFVRQVHADVSRSLMSWMWAPLLLENYGGAVASVEVWKNGRGGKICFNTQKLRELLAYE